MSKTVILAVPYLYGLDLCIEKNLRHHGFNVINLCFDDRDTHYPHLGSRLVGLYHKLITRDGDYKKRLRFMPYQQEIDRRLAALGGRKADFALCIRANIYPEAVIRKIRNHAEVCVNYQWDGIDRFPDILNYLPYFDRFFVFDQHDVEKYPQYGFQTASNFYFDFPLAGSPQPSENLYYLGGYEARREAEVKSFIEAARRLKLPLDFYIYCKDNRAEQAFGREGITYLTRETVLDFEQNLQKTQNCRAVVDFVSPDHQGCSFRIFDAMRFGKKLITSNAAVARCDFYHPDNIFIWNGENAGGLGGFLERPYRRPDAAVMQQYSFSGWFGRLTGEPLPGGR